MKKLNLSLLALLALPAASQAAYSQIALSQNSQLIFAEDVPASQMSALQRDLLFMNSLQLEDDAELQQAMETQSSLTPALLSQWLAERVQYVISETMNKQRSMHPLAMNYPYENPAALPLDKPPYVDPDFSPIEIPSTSPKIKSVTVMSNMGAGVYSTGKQMHMLVGLRVPGVGMVPASSPRMGIIQIGAGMFSPIFERSGLADTTARAYSIFRLGTLFHEARHSDGNGESLGLFHTYCPIGHDFEGHGACDLATNGAYVLGALFERVLAAACSDCSVAEREVIRLDIADSFNRVLPEGPKYPAIALQIVRCKRAALDKAALTSEARASCAQTLNGPVETVKASPWDDRSEGRRTASYVPSFGWSPFGFGLGLGLGFKELQ